MKWSEMKVTHSCLTLCNVTDYRVHEFLQARILEWVAFPFSRESSQPRDRTQVSHIAGGFLTSWVTREAQEYWGGQPIPSPADLPDPGIKPGSPALQVVSLPAKLSVKPLSMWYVSSNQTKKYPYLIDEDFLAHKLSTVSLWPFVICPFS